MRNDKPAASLFFVWATLVWAAAPVSVHAADEQWQVGFSPSFSSGNYGTGERTAVFHTPLVARRLFGDGDLTFVVPFTCVSGNVAVTIVNGSPVRSGGTDANVSRNSGTERGGTVRGGSSTTPLPASNTTSCGLGDIVVRGRYYLADERGWLPTVALRAHVKAPTASAEQGLGTGRPDEGVAVEVTRTLPGALSAMVDAGLTIVGEPEGVNYNNNWWYDVGIGRDFASGFINVSGFFAEDRAVVPGLPNSRELLAVVGIKGTQGWRMQISGNVGLSDGAPDLGVAVGASRRF